MFLGGVKPPQIATNTTTIKAEGGGVRNTKKKKSPTVD